MFMCSFLIIICLLHTSLLECKLQGIIVSCVFFFTLNPVLDQRPEQYKAQKWESNKDLIKLDKYMPQMKETLQTAEGQMPSAVANTLGFGVRHGSLMLALRSCRSLASFPTSLDFPFLR